MSTFLIISGVILFLWFAFPITLNVLNFANILGIIFSLILCIYGGFFKKINSFFKNLRKKRIAKVILTIFMIFSAAVLSLAIVITAFMVSACNTPSQKDSTVVVLGCKVNPNGPSIMLLSRLEAAYDYLSENEDAACVLSGGQGTDELVSEAQAMRDWLTEKGIDESRLLIEDKSTSTMENILFSKEIIEKNGLSKEITVITNEFHEYRAKRISEDAGLTFHSCAAQTPFYLFPTYYVRELFAVVNEFLK